MTVTLKVGNVSPVKVAADVVTTVMSASVQARLGSAETEGDADTVAPALFVVPGVELGVLPGSFEPPASALNSHHARSASTTMPTMTASRRFQYTSGG